jgi:hypothetical protein
MKNQEQTKNRISFFELAADDSPQGLQSFEDEF